MCVVAAERYDPEADDDDGEKVSHTTLSHNITCQFNVCGREKPSQISLMFDTYVDQHWLRWSDRQAWRGRLRPRLGSQAAPSAED